MEQIVKVLDKEIVPVEYKGERFVTFRQVDELHGRLEGTARKAFYSNKDRFIEGVDYVKLPYGVWSQMTAVRNTDCGLVSAVRQTDSSRDQHNSMIFLTESGYLLVTKPFMDNHSWKIQRELVQRYFIVEAIKAGRFQVMPAPTQSGIVVNLQKELLSKNLLWAKIMRYMDMGLTRREICKLVERDKSTVRCHVRRMEACGLIAPPTNLPVRQRTAEHLH